jgi:hypothetical protein
VNPTLSAVEAVTVSRTYDAALVQPIEFLLLAPEVALRHRVRRRIVLSFLGGGLLAHGHIKLHAAICHCRLTLLETIRNAFLRQRVGVRGLTLALVIGTLFWRRASRKREQDCEINTHRAPLEKVDRSRDNCIRGGLYVHRPLFSQESFANVRKEYLRQAANA